MTSPQKWTTGQDIAEQPGMAEMPLPSPADDAPTQPDDVLGSRSTRIEFQIDEPQAVARQERKAGSSVAPGSPTTEGMSDVTTEAPAATRTSTPSQQTLNALLAVRSSTDEAIAVARLQLKTEADAASDSPPAADLSAKMSEAGQKAREKVRASAFSSLRQAATQVVLQHGARFGHEARPEAERGIPATLTLTPADLSTKMTEAGKEDGKSPEQNWDSVSPLLTQAPTLTYTDKAVAVATLSRWAVRRAARKKCPKSAVLPPAAELNAPNLSLQLQQMQEQIQQQMQQQKQQMQEQMQQMQMQMQMQLHRWGAPPDDQHGGKSISPTAEDPQVDVTSTLARFSGLNAANSDPQSESPDSVGRKVAVEQAKVFFLNSGDLPPDLAFHKDLSTIKHLFESQPDLTFSRWRRRGVYTEDNFDQWVEWAPLGKAHLDAFTMLLKFDKKNLLVAPNLRKSDPEIAAEAWDTYRKGLLNGIQQALTMGCKWKQILTNLSLAFSDPESGYPKLQLAVKLALMDTKLMQYPLLHADVFMCKLDKSFAAGSAKYSDDSCSAEWDQTLSRRPGEDALSLAIRVQSAYLETLQHMELDDITVYQDKFHSQQLKNRYDKCLSNDPDDPARGHRSAEKFRTGWEEWLVDQEYGVRHMPPNLERVVRLSVMSYENSRAHAAQAQLPDEQAVAGQYLAIEEISEDPPWRNS